MTENQLGSRDKLPYLSDLISFIDEVTCKMDKVQIVEVMYLNFQRVLDNFAKLPSAVDEIKSMEK